MLILAKLRRERRCTELVERLCAVIGVVIIGENLYAGLLASLCSIGGAFFSSIL